MTDNITLDSIRDALVRQEDVIIYSLIQRANFPINSKAYSVPLGDTIHEFSGSLAEFVARQTEAAEAKAGRYENPEEIPFYPDNLPPPLITLGNFPKILYPAAANVNVSKAIWDIYTNRFLPLFVAEGDDGNYASTTACDLTCLQALSRRIHYGRYVAEVKFQVAPEQYEPLIRAKDKDAIMKLLTDARVEDMVKKRVKKKATVFGQEVNSNGTVVEGKYKVDPQVVYHLYSEWVIPLTKVVEVEYLLGRLD